MSNPISGNPQGLSPGITTPYKRNRLSGFHRLQAALAWWGLLILAGGWLHNTNSQQWGTAGVLLMWVMVAILGFAGNYWLAPAILSSGALFIWTTVVAVGLVISWVVLYPLAANQYWPFLSVSWHLLIAAGYFVNGIVDRRLWWLGGWELLMATLMAYVGLNPPPPAGSTPLMLGSFNFYYNQGLLLGLTSGIPLLLAALPIWKEKYSRG